MSDALFVPVTCAACQRVSVVTLSQPFLKRQLRNGSPVRLICAYDDFVWDATRDELTRMAKLLKESEKVAGSSWLRLRQSGINESAPPPLG